MDCFYKVNGKCCCGCSEHRSSECPALQNCEHYKPLKPEVH